MARIRSNGIELEYETFGRAGDPALLLIMGLGGQLVLWPDSFCENLARAGHHVIRYDNRDVGLSSKMDHLGKPNLVRSSLAYRLGLPVRAPYSLDDMTLDAVGLLDALGVESAHVVGMSMGGMIAQLLAARHAPRVRSLTSIMSSSGSRRVPGPKLAVQLRLVRRPQRLDREGLIAHGMQTWRMIGSPGFPEDEPVLRDKVARQLERNIHPQGFVRQMTAIMASGSRAPLLRRVTAPALIIHGKEDPLVPVPAAHDLARHLPHARVEIIDGMGHDLPRALLPRIERSILRHVEAAERGGR
ncbi:alpha/beta hydrolase [Fontimonas sp. SYSU GA230001]|uniref:alpha/beta fold hydrolase n=1 Tax=Fontimonas sp. SYSU GA230001 TaxID=3142450 RepID=UPI0032B5C00F